MLYYRPKTFLLILNSIFLFGLKRQEFTIFKQVAIQKYRASKNLKLKNNLDRTVLGGTVAPQVKVYQIFAGNQTIKSLKAVGKSLKWYASLHGNHILCSTEFLKKNHCYYVTQTVNNIESRRVKVKVKQISKNQQIHINGELVSDLSTNSHLGADVKWFRSQQGMVSLLPSERLQEGTYYAQEYFPATQKVVPLVGSGIFGSKNAQGLQASFKLPFGITFDSKGYMYVADTFGNSIRKVSPKGNVTTFISNIPHPKLLEFDSQGNLFVINSTFNAYQITPDKKIHLLHDIIEMTSLAYSKIDDCMYFCGGNAISKFDLSTNKLSNFTTIVNSAITSLAVDSFGFIYAVDNFGKLIYKISNQGTAQVWAGNGNYLYRDGPGSEASFSTINAISIDKDNNLYLSELNKIRKVSINQEVSTLVSNGLKDPVQTAFDLNGRLFVVDFGLNRIFKITPGLTSNRIGIQVLLKLNRS